MATQSVQDSNNFVNLLNSQASNVSEVLTHVKHIVNTEFSLLLSTLLSPILVGGQPLLDPSGWAISIQIISESGTTYNIPGSWLNIGNGTSVPYRMLFQSAGASNAAWIPGLYKVRLHTTDPDSREYKIDTLLMVKVSA